MSVLVQFVFVAVAGLFLGSLFYGGLWLTVRKGIHAKHPAVLFLLSFLVRVALVVAGFYLVCGDQWPRFLVCMGGFLVARLVVSKTTQHLSNDENSLRKEVES